MKTLKSLTLVAALVFITLNVSAQEKAAMDPQAMAQRQTDNIKKNVTGLTSDQESKILAVEQESANISDTRGRKL